MGLRFALPVLALLACAPARVTPFTPWEEQPDPATTVDLVIDGIGFEPYEGVTLWAHVLEADSPPMPAHVEDGLFSLVLPASYAPETARFLTLAILVDHDDGWCSDGDVEIFALATVVESGDPTFAFVDLDDPDAMYEPCVP